MRKQMAGTLALIVALAGLPLGSRTSATLSQTDAAAAPMAQARGTAIRGATRKDPRLTRLISTSVAVPVPGYADIFLAGRIFPFSIAGRYGTDVAERNGPPRVRIEVTPGHAITVVASFATADGFAGTPAPNANGDTKRVILAGPAQPGIRPLGLSSVRAPINGLVGVFTGAKAGAGKAPPPLSFSTARQRDAATLKPRLNQVFFIGTGLTGRGLTKRFIIPKGTVYLYLGSLDYAGSNHDNHGTIRAIVTGARVVAVPVAPTPTRTPVPTRTPKPRRTPTPKPRRTPTPAPTRKIPGTPTGVPVIGVLFPTNTMTGTPIPTPSPVLPSGGFQYNAQGQIVNAQGTPVALNTQGTPINTQGTPVNAQGTAVNIQGTPVNVQGTPVNVQGTPLPTNTPLPGVPTSTPLPTATPLVVTSATATSLPTATAIPTPIVQSLNEAWSQYQFDERHNGYQAQDTANALAGSALDLDPNADANSPFFAGRLHALTQSPAINGNVQVAGGPVLGLNGVYFTTGQDASLRCVWANGAPGSGFGCPAGFTRISFGSNVEDNVPVINPNNPSENIIYYLSHNNPTGTTIPVTINGATVQSTGSLTAYNANTGGAVASYTSSPPLTLPTAPGVALTVNSTDTICYVPTLGNANAKVLGYLYFLSCGPNGTGQEALAPDGITHIAPIDLRGTPLSGAAIDAADNLVLVAVQNANGTSGSLKAFNATTGNPTPVWTAALPGNGATYTPFQPIVLCKTICGGAGDREVSVVAATNHGIAAYSLPGGASLWTQTGSVVGAGATGGAGCSGIPGGVTVTFNAEDTPGYDPFPTGSDVPSIYVGLPAGAGQQATNSLVRLDANTGAVCAVGSFSTTVVPVSGAPVTDTGAPTTNSLTSLVTARDVVYYADNSGAVYVLDASTLAPLINTTTHALPDAARSGIPGLAAGSPPIGASLIVANGHLYFGNGSGTIFNYSY